MRLAEVVQATDVQNGDRQIEGRFHVGRMKGAGLCRVLIHTHVHLEDSFDVRHRPVDIQQRAIGMHPRHCQTPRLRKADERLVILLRRAELLRELLRSQIMAEIRD